MKKVSNNKILGFTLIELLAVITLLAVISLIVFPVINKSIYNSKVRAYDTQIDIIEEAAHKWVISNSYDLSEAETQAIWVEDLISSGFITKTDDGVIKNPMNGVDNIDGCVVVRYIENYNQYTYSYDEDCDSVEAELVNMDINFEVLGDVLNEHNWAKEDFYVKVTTPGISFKWCSTTGTTCEPSAEVINNVGSVYIETESDVNKICVIAYDKRNNYSDTICSDNYKLDKTIPSFEGVEDLVVNRNEVVDLSSGVLVNDSLSGIVNAFSYNPTSIDTSMVGSTDIIYTTSDLAGNTNTITRKVIVDAEAPTVTYTALGDKINSNGWAKEDFYVEASINDQSGLGIDSAKWCSTTEDTCEPLADMIGTSMTPLVSLESNNNRICIEATDNNGKTSEVLCSDAYKLDKTVPNVGSINITGTLGSNNWYTSDVAINSINGSDALSGHHNTSVDISNITSNTAGTTVTITTTDLAGNTSSTNEVVKVDKDTPSIIAVSGDIEITKGDSNLVSSYFIPTYSISGGSMSCNPINTSSLNSGTQTVNCMANGNNGLSSTASKIVTVTAPDNSGANAPKLFNNMVAVKYNGSDWVVADTSKAWYNYDNKEWANAVVFKSGITKSLGSVINVDTEVSQMYVWIPRYKYTIFNGNNGNVSRQEIQIYFESGTSKSGTVRCNDAISGNGLSSETCTDSTYGSVTNGTSTYTHPAFCFGHRTNGVCSGTELTGIWVGKFETSNVTSCTSADYSVNTGCDRINLGIQIKPNVTYWQGARVSTFYTTIRNLAGAYSINANSHMMKNMEWGAVAYLSQSKYGKNAEVSVNTDSLYTGGTGDVYKTNVGQSTTGNIYGVYDMSGGSYEYVMGNMVATSNVPEVGRDSTYNSGFTGRLWDGGSYSGVSFPSSKYYDAYTFYNRLSDCTRGKLGDATKETMKDTGSIVGCWYSDFAFFTNDLHSWFFRGGDYDGGSTSGIFNFYANTGESRIGYSARAVISDN